jgi:hypothetical protein
MALTEGKQIYPSIQLKIDFFSSDLVRIKKKAILKLPENVVKELKFLARFHDDFDLVSFLRLIDHPFSS